MSFLFIVLPKYIQIKQRLNRISLMKHQLHVHVYAVPVFFAMEGLSVIYPILCKILENELPFLF